MIQNKNKIKGDSIFICDASEAKEEDLVSAFKYQAELNRKTALVESSLSMALTGVTILSQYYQLAELKSQLNACLSANRSQALYNQLQYNIARTHIQMTLNLSVGALTLGKFGAIYLNDGSKYRIFNKMSTGIGKINAIISIIDSVGSFAKASGALKQGDEGSTTFYVISAAQLIVAVVGIICPVSILVTLAIEVCTMIISLFFEYDDSLMWDDISKWLNRTMLGKFGRNDLLPPYPITDTVILAKILDSTHLYNFLFW